MELNTRYTLTTAEGISPEGIVEIHRLIQNTNILLGEWATLNSNPLRKSWLPALPYDWEWYWLVTEGEWRGTFPKRVSQYFHKRHGLKCPASFLAQLGNLARRYATESVTYQFEFVKRFDWEAGDYGDGPSCYWGSHSGALDMLAQNDAMAIRFYDENAKGIARAWVVDLDSDGYIVFNGYGFQDATLTIARVLARFLGFTFWQIRLANNGTDTGMLYINSGSGYAVAHPETERYMNHDLGWDEYYADYCYDCGRGLNEDDIYIGADDEIYCERCFDRYFERCDNCGQVHEQGTLKRIGDDWACARCCISRYTRCPKCRRWTRNYDAREIRGRRYCYWCSLRVPTK